MDIKVDKGNFWLSLNSSFLTLISMQINGVFDFLQFLNFVELDSQYVSSLFLDDVILFVKRVKDSFFDEYFELCPFELKKGFQ